MPGVKGKSGGPRTGTGPKIKTWTLKHGQTDFIMWETDPQGERINIGNQTTVEVVDRMTLKLKASDGTTYTIVRIL